MLLCVGMLAGCGDTDTNKPDSGNAGNTVDTPDKPDKPNSGDKTDSDAADVPDIDYDDLVSSSGGDLTPDPGKVEEDETEYKDLVAEITAINPNEISYKVYESKTGAEITDYSLVTTDDYKATDKTGTLQYDAETPFYYCREGMWYMADISTVPVGSMMVIATVEETGALEGVIIFDVAE